METPLNDNLRQPDGPEHQDLRELHRLHRAFMDEMAQHRDRAYPVREYSDFVQWWNGLRPDVRSTCARHYRLGYHALLQEGKGQVRRGIEDHPREE
jgi:hypothetical protein